MCLVCVKEQLASLPRTKRDFARNYLEAGGCISKKTISEIKIESESVPQSLFMMFLPTKTTGDMRFGLYSNTPEDVQRAVRETAAA